MIDFFSLAYLKTGTPKQQEVYQVISSHCILEFLHGFTPVVIGTFPLDIAIETSDIDIACCFESIELFREVVRTHFNVYDGFTDSILSIRKQQTYVANFTVANFPVEIFAQSLPVDEQYGYRHMCIEHAILQQMGLTFKEKIIACKQAGMKTEPAFANLLHLEGDPYESLLHYQV